MPAGAACTGIYVGKDVSADGSVIFARSNDYPDVWGNHIKVTPRLENELGRLMPISADGKIKTEIPATTFKYTSTPFMNSTQAYNELCSDATACTNEYGVSITMAVTAFPNNASLEATP